MTARTFRLTQIHQRVDERLRMASRNMRPDWHEIATLKKMKLRVKDALHRVSKRGN